MSSRNLQDFFLWCTAINYGVLLLWFVAFVNCRSLMHRFHSRWFRLSEEAFDALNYGGIGIYKLGIFLFNLVPWIALEIVG